MFTLPRDLSVTGTARALAPEARIRVRGPVTVRRQWLDTFDWRLHGAGLMLEHQREGVGGRLLLHTGSGDVLEVRAAADAPWFTAELPTAVLRRRLAGVLGKRALLARSTVGCSLHEIRLLDRREKTVARVEVYRPARRGPCMVRVLPLRGFEAQAARAMRRLAGLEGARPLDTDPLCSAAVDLATEPGGHPGWKPPRLDPAMRTDDAMLVLLRHYRVIMDLNIAGMVQDLDTEFLHDFRVGLRRSRALLRRVPGVFAPARLAPFADDLRWLGQVTSPPRDADVHALEFPAYIAALPGTQAAALGPLMAKVEEERRIAHRDLVAAVNSARFRRRWAAWGRFLDTEPPRSSRQARARQAVAVCSLESTMKAARRVRREGRKIGSESLPAEYHELRKFCKNLRYLIDAFGELLPIKDLTKVKRRLKNLQDVLGEYQDLDVHREAILRLHKALADDGVLPGETHEAMEHLVAELANRAARARGHFEAEFRGFLDVSLDRRLRGAAP